MWNEEPLGVELSWLACKFQLAEWLSPLRPCGLLSHHGAFGFAGDSTSSITRSSYSHCLQGLCKVGKILCCLCYPQDNLTTHALVSDQNLLSFAVFCLPGPRSLRVRPRHFLSMLCRQDKVQRGVTFISGEIHLQPQPISKVEFKKPQHAIMLHRCPPPTNCHHKQLSSIFPSFSLFLNIPSLSL